eukprot:gene25838-31031_t
MSEFTVPGLSSADGSSVADILQERLSAYNDLHLTLKHVHWNVVGPNFIGVHEMIDPQVELVRGYADDVAERIAALGNSPKGTAGAIERDRTWDDYSVGRDDARAHLAALDLVYTGIITDSRTAIDSVGKIDPITEDMLIGQTAQLEKFQWFVRAHLENSGGSLVHEGASTEQDAANEARKGKSMSADSRGTSTQTRREYQMFVLQQRLLFGSIVAGTALGVLAITYF